MDNRNTAEPTRSTAQGGIVNTMKERATAQLSTQKGKATEGLDVVAQAVRQTTQQLRESQHDTIAQYIERAAEQLERFSTTVRNKDVTDLLREAQQLARRQPALFIGGSFAIGLLAARFLKSSRQDDGAYDRDMYDDVPGPAAPATRFGSADYQSPPAERF
jgi:hypothetical protein